MLASDNEENLAMWWGLEDDCGLLQVQWMRNTVGGFVDHSTKRNQLDWVEVGKCHRWIKVKT
jgi:hypothetical protein